MNRRTMARLLMPVILVAAVIVLELNRSLLDVSNRGANERQARCLEVCKVPELEADELSIISAADASSSATIVTDGTARTTFVGNAAMTTYSPSRRRNRKHRTYGGGA
jgi:hypothetical protein